MRPLPLTTRVLSAFLLWTAARSLQVVYLGQTGTDYRVATEAAFGPLVWVAEGAYAFLATGAVAGIWLRWKRTAMLVAAALAVSASLLLFQLQRMEADPATARESYAASRRARGFPLPEERLDSMFSASGRRMTWAVGAALTLAPLALLLWRHRDFTPADDTED